MSVQKKKKKDRRHKRIEKWEQRKTGSICGVKRAGAFWYSDKT